MDGPFRLDRSLISVSGPDAVGFLDNLLTQDVDGLQDLGVLYAALLSPQGKLVCDMLLWRHGEDVILDVDPARAPDLMRRLAMYKLRAQVALEDVSDKLHALYAAAPMPGFAPDPRFPNGELGYRALQAAGQVQADGAATYHARRLALGAPDLARDAASEEVFALEALLEELNGVDFGKGCFVGQENVSRMKRRATTRRKFCPIVFEGDPPPPGAVLTAGAAQIGTVRSGAEGRAMALVRLDRAFEAAEAGHTLSVEGRIVRLDPPDWLILPQRGASSGEAD